MIFNVSLDATKALDRINRGHKLPYLAVLAINETARQVQAAERDQLMRAFTVRKRDFLLKQVKLLRAGFDIKAGSGNWEARVGIGIGRALQGRPLLLPQFEEGGTRRGIKGGGVAIPVEARGSKAQSVPEALFVQRLQLRRTTRGRPKKNAKPVKAGTITRKGLLGTYQVSGVGIFQREGDESKLLYLFKPTVKLPPRLQFFATAARVINANFARNVQRLVNDAFARYG